MGCDIGQKSVDPTPPGSDRITIAELESLFASTELCNNVKTPNATLVYAEEITSINDVFNIPIRAALVNCRTFTYE